MQFFLDIPWNTTKHPSHDSPSPGGDLNRKPPEYVSRAVFLNRGINYTGPREILLELITNLNVILYLSTCHTVHIIVLILFMIMP